MHFTLNGRTVEASPDDPEMPLLYLLRGDAFALSGPKFGCGLAQCGACTVLLDGVATRSCAIPAEAVDGRAVTTLEGLGTPASPHPLQAAFVAENAAQCGYCANGMILQSADLLARDPRPTEAAIREALAHNLCRCGTHQRIVKAVQRAASAGPAP
jgi:nicotinate dehydrogenase subunit A